jgi:hypothetical protein
MQNGDLVMAKVCFADGQQLPLDSFIIFRRVGVTSPDVAWGDLVLGGKIACFSTDSVKVIIRAADAQ